MYNNGHCIHFIIQTRELIRQIAMGLSGHSRHHALPVVAIKWSGSITLLTIVT
jgi:hypothetical protein